MNKIDMTHAAALMLFAAANGICRACAAEPPPAAWLPTAPGVAPLPSAFAGPWAEEVGGVPAAAFQARQPPLAPVAAVSSVPPPGRASSAYSAMPTAAGPRRRKAHDQREPRLVSAAPMASDGSAPGASATSDTHETSEPDSTKFATFTHVAQSTQAEPSTGSAQSAQAESSTDSPQSAQSAQSTPSVQSTQAEQPLHAARSVATARASQPAQAVHAAAAAAAANGPNAVDPLDAAPAPWPEADTVQALLRAETERAIIAARRRAAMMADASQAAVPPLAMPTGVLPSGRPGQYDQEGGAPTSAEINDHLQLAAIYGVGQRLHVEILVNGRRTLYRAGHRIPVERDLAGQPYTLAAIAGGCVRLQAPGRERSACLGQSSARGH